MRTLQQPEGPQELNLKRIQEDSLELHRKEKKSISESYFLLVVFGLLTIIAFVVNPGAGAFSLILTVLLVFSLKKSRKKAASLEESGNLGSFSIYSVKLAKSVPGDADSDPYLVFENGANFTDKFSRYWKHKVGETFYVVCAKESHATLLVYPATFNTMSDDLSPYMIPAPTVKE